MTGVRQTDYVEIQPDSTYLDEEEDSDPIGGVHCWVELAISSHIIPIHECAMAESARLLRSEPMPSVRTHMLGRLHRVSVSAATRVHARRGIVPHYCSRRRVADSSRCDLDAAFGTTEPATVRRVFPRSASPTRVHGIRGFDRGGARQ